MAKEMFTREQLIGWELPWEAQENNIIGKRRWSVTREIVFRHPETGKFYRTEYSEAATESQDERPWEYMDTVECEEVTQVEKTVLVWEAV